MGHPELLVVLRLETLFVPLMTIGPSRMGHPELLVVLRLETLFVPLMTIGPS